MSIKLASWNVEGRLAGYSKNKRGTAEAILAGIAKLDADIIVLPEAYLDVPQEGVDAALKKMGYTWLDVQYDDYGRETEKYMIGSLSLRILSRLPLNEVKYVRWGNVRNLLVCTVEDPKSNRTIRIIPIHLDDRSEAQRMKQVQDIVTFITNDHYPTVMLGDFNAMWPRGRAKVLSSKLTRLMIQHIPHEDIRYALVRLSDMALGIVLNVLKKAGLRDADQRFQSTATPKMRGMEYLPSIRLAQIDHILVTHDIAVADCKVSKDEGSDHRAISATLSF